MADVWFEKIKKTGILGLETSSPHILIIGSSGSGKSNTSENIIHQRVVSGSKKVFEIGDTDRWECFGYLLPETNPVLVKLIKEMSGLKPECVNTEIIAISGTDLETVNKIPKCINIMSIDINDIKLSDLETTFANDAGKVALGYILMQYGDMNIAELTKFLKEQLSLGNDSDKQLPKQTIGKILRRIYSAQSSGVFSDDFEHINFKKLFSETKKLTVFNLSFIESEEDRGLATSLIIKNIAYHQKHLRQPTTLYYRECAQTFSKTAPSDYFLAKRILEQIARQGRDLQFSLLLDTQRLSDIPPPIRRNMGTVVCMRMDMGDASALNFDIATLDALTLQKIPSLNTGEAVIIHSGQYERPIFVPPTRHYHKKPSDKPFWLLGQVFGWKQLTKKNGEEKFIKEQESDESWAVQMNKLRKKKTVQEKLT